MIGFIKESINLKSQAAAYYVSWVWLLLWVCAPLLCCKPIELSRSDGGFVGLDMRSGCSTGTPPWSLLHLPRILEAEAGNQISDSRRLGPANFRWIFPIDETGCARLPLRTLRQVNPDRAHQIILNLLPAWPAITPRTFISLSFVHITQLMSKFIKIHWDIRTSVGVVSWLQIWRSLHHQHVWQEGDCSEFSRGRKIRSFDCSRLLCTWLRYAEDGSRRQREVLGTRTPLLPKDCAGGHHRRESPQHSSPH